MDNPSQRLSFGIDFILQRNATSSRLSPASRPSTCSSDEGTNGLSSNGNAFSITRDVTVTSLASFEAAPDDESPVTSSTFDSFTSWTTTRPRPVAAPEFSSDCQPAVVDHKISSSKRWFSMSQSIADVRHERIPPSSSSHEGNCSLLCETRLPQGELYNTKNEKRIIRVRQMAELSRWGCCL